MADVRIKPMNLNQVEEFLRKRLKKLEFTDEESKTIRYALIGISRADTQEETFLRNPYYLSLWLFLLAVERRDGSPVIPSIDKLHMLELKREMAKVKGNNLRNVDDNLVDITTKILSVLSFHLLKLSLQTEVHQGVHLSDSSLLQAMVEILLPIHNQSYDLLTQSRLSKYSSLIAKNSDYDSEASAEDVNFLKLLKVLFRSITRYSTFATGNKDIDLKLVIVIASVVEQAHKNNLIEMNIDQASFFRFFNQRAADYLAACFLRRIGLSSILGVSKINFWLSRTIAIALASSEEPQAILSSINTIPRDPVFESAIVDGLILFPSHQKKKVEKFINRLTCHLLDEDRFFSPSYDPCDPLRVLRQIRRLCSNGYSHQIDFMHSLFQKLMSHRDASISEAATVTLITYASQVPFSRKLWLILFQHLLRKALRFESWESFSSLWIAVKDTQR